MTQPHDRVRLRVASLGVIAFLLMSALAVRVWFLQVLAADEYRRAAMRNGVRIVPVEPARGRILDRNGEVLVGNRPSLVISIRREELRNKPDTLARLASLLSMPRERIESRLTDRRVLPYTPVPIAEDVPESAVVYVLEHRDEFPGVVAETRPVRVYPRGTLAAHALGYLGEIGPDQLGEAKFRGVRQGSFIGRTGLEAAYEVELRGKEGLVKLQVSSSGKVVGPPLGRREPTTGFDLVTTIDSRVQGLVEESLALGIAKARTIFDEDFQKRYLAPSGGAMVLDPRNGEILAMASYPSYDPGLFVGGISKEHFRALSLDPTRPLLDRVTQAALPPGSTFKIVTAAAALQDGLASGSGRFACPASMRLFNQTFRNWREADGGSISLPQALIESCDTVFYAFGAEFWRRFKKGGGERLQDYARQFGLGSPTGIEIPFEKKGLVPDEGWLKVVHARFPQAFPYKVWLPGYTINMSIGQGDLTTTPLQLAGAYASVANNGTIFRPRLGLGVMDGDRRVRTVPAQERRRLSIAPAHLETIRRGLERV
ncbi:MAG: penicillin-binding protein 2, partial [Candidatus Methylomirabilales bacterium]